MVWQGECRVDYTCYIWYTVLCRVHLFAIFCVSYLVVYQFWFVIFNELIPYESMVVLLPMYVLTFPYICFCWVYLFSNLKHFCYWVRVRPCILMCVSTHLRIFVLADFVSCCILVLVVCVFFYFYLSCWFLLCCFSSVCASFYFSIFAIHKHIVCLLFVVRSACSIFLDHRPHCLLFPFGDLCSHVLVEYFATLSLQTCIACAGFCFHVNPTISSVMSCSSFSIPWKCYCSM